MPYGHKVVTQAYEWKAVAHRPTTGLPNSINTGAYNAYATFTIKDRVTKEVLWQGGPAWKGITLQISDSFASAGIAAASALLLMASAF